MRTPTYQQLVMLQRLELSNRRGMYQWTHPENVAWAESRYISGPVSLRTYCRRLEDRIRALEAERYRQRAADSQGPAQAGGDHADEPLVVRRRGMGGKPHAK